MNRQALQEQVEKAIAGRRTGVLATVEENKPHVRYMTFYHDGLTLYTPTKLDTEKVAEIEKNPSVSVLLGYEQEGTGDTYVQISGTSAIHRSEQIKRRFWEESFRRWFDGPDDPNYVFLQIEPETIRILNRHGQPAQELHYQA